MRRLGIALLLLVLLGPRGGRATPSTEEDTASVDAFVDAFITYFLVEDAVADFTGIPGAELSPPPEPECAKQAAADRRADKEQESSKSEVLESPDGRRGSRPAANVPDERGGQGLREAIHRKELREVRRGADDVSRQGHHERRRGRASEGERAGRRHVGLRPCLRELRERDGYESSFSLHSIVGRTGPVAFKISVYGPTDTFTPVSDARAHGGR